MRLVLLGPPGAGKGTQAKVLSQNLNLIHLSTGDIFREAVKANDANGKKLAQYMQKGQLVPDEMVNQVVIERLKDKDIQNRFILDGFPRTKPQAIVLDEFLAAAQIPLDMVVSMETSKDVIITRLTGRRGCKECGGNYHIKNMPPKQEGICDNCGNKLTQRDDDVKETVLERLRVYNEQTTELIDYYKAKGLLQTVDGNLEANKLCQILSQLFRTKELL